jgi:phosphatidylserine/phosphatidylglycerophosphate/cardiolipin synthase-like enzyme
VNVLKPHLQSTVFTLLERNKSQRQIERLTGIDRKTIRRYQAIFESEKSASANSPRVTTGSEAAVTQTPPPPRPPATADSSKAATFNFARSASEPHREWIEQQVRLRRNAQAIYQHLVLSNTYDSTTHDDDKENAPAREALHHSGVDVIDRMLPDGSHIGHNKFMLYADAYGKPAAVLTGSTNWTPTGLCAQTNNSIVLRSPTLASAYSTYWDALKKDTIDAGTDPHALQSKTFRTENASPIGVQIPGAKKATLWFSPNTQQKNKAKGVTPPDMEDVYARIGRAKSAVLFLAFDPGQPSIIDAAASAQEKNSKLFIRGALTNADRAGNFVIDLHNNNTKPTDPAQVVPTEGVNDAFGVWEKELAKAGHAVIHDKIVVIDPFDPEQCTVVVGSHNLGNKASSTNDENLLIIEGNVSLACAYAVHVLDVYDHYRWRYLLAQHGTKDSWQGLHEDDSWQDTYFSSDGKPNNAELAFWLEASTRATDGHLAAKPKRTAVLET